MMAKEKWIFLMLTGVLSALSVIFITVSFSTNYWVVAEAKFDDTNFPTDNIQVSYGLFDGHLKRYLLTTSTRHDLSVVCDYAVNKCVYSCQQTSENRIDELRRLLNDERLNDCPISSAKFTMTQSVESRTNIEARAKQYDNEFLNASLLITTVVFLSATATFALLSGFFSMINIFFNPSHTLLSVFGLYIWNGITIGLCSLTMIMWGSLYIGFISDNIGITDTLRSLGHYSSHGLSSLGYSYWILFIPIVLHFTNIALVYYRCILLSRQPPPPVITVAKNDSTILVY